MSLLDAGYSANEMKGLNCGVFVGTSASPGGRPSNTGKHSSKDSVYSATGSSASIASGRISYVFNFQGPNAAYDTACSSSLVALDAAVSALQLGKCNMSLVAGANELFHYQVFEVFARAGMLSPTGRCHTWDASANGYLRGEGCGAILLMPANASNKGSIYAHVLGASTISDGTSASITAPNGSAQGKLIERALKASGIKPSDVDYIEAHGTGTALGDPIEIEAMAEVFTKSRTKSSPLVIGSVKSNIGHLECSAGIAGLIKTVLVLVHEHAPPNAGLENVNPLIKKTVQSHSFAIDFPLEVKTIAREEGGKLLVAGVSSFGYSGTIAHAIVQQAPKDMCRSDIGVGQCIADDVQKLSDNVIFLFTGQGSQYAGMGKELYRANKDFQEAMDLCESAYKMLTDGDSLLYMIFASNEEGLVTRNAQPALVSLEWSLARMWKSNGVAPRIVLGHSVGEIAAACVAGAMSIETALELSVARQRLVNQLSHNRQTQSSTSHSPKSFLICCRHPHICNGRPLYRNCW